MINPHNAPEGFTAEAETYPDGSLTLSLLDPHGHTLAVGRWLDAVPAEEVNASGYPSEVPVMQPAEAWPASA